MTFTYQKNPRDISALRYLVTVLKLLKRENENLDGISLFKALL
ncbi:MAG: hypothetical protein ACRCXY_01160 [Fusobacteriaceae bacterium]